jgi:hypothetical protein
LHTEDDASILIDGSLIEMRMERINTMVGLVADGYAQTVCRKRSGIVDRTPPGARQNGKLHAIDRMEIYLRHMDIETLILAGDEAVFGEISLRAAKYAQALLEESRLYNAAFRSGMEDALRMVGGHVLQSLTMVVKNMDKPSSE